jgi:hypothetical protein
MPRAALAAVLTAAALAAIPSSAAAPAPVVTLLTPAADAVVYSSTTTTAHPTFRWHVDWSAPQETMVVWQIGADAAFTTNAMSESQYCPAANVNCWTSYTPQRIWGPPYGSVWYWRVGVNTPGGMVYSPTWKFRAVTPGDKDKDGVPDYRDDCPSTKNPAQRDTNHDGKGDACQPDILRPRVHVFAGSARRGQRAYVTVRVADERGWVGLRLALTHFGHVVYRGRYTWPDSRWDTPVTFHTRTRLPMFLQRGHYQACMTASDHAGNSRRSCARYLVR